MAALKRFLAGVMFLGLINLGWSLPVLQLDILGGTYDRSTETIVAPNDANPNGFYVRALWDNSKSSLVNSFYLSAAITPKVAPSINSSIPPNFGSFSINGQVYNSGLGGGMLYGNPPMNDPAGVLFDSGDLSQHSVFPTYYAEIGFSFVLDSAHAIAAYNSQDDTAGRGNLVFQDFYVDISDLVLLADRSGYAVHFDLYHELNKTARNGAITDLDVDKFAPFSHDAQSLTVVRQVPEAGSTLALLGLGLCSIFFIHRPSATKQSKA